MPEILIIGGSGFVASKIIENSFSSNRKLIVPSKSDLNISNIDSIRKSIRDVDVVVNFAAYTNVKEATLDTDGLAWKINVEGADNVAKVCKEADKFLIHISTDGVFPITDDSKGPHMETEKVKDDSTLVSAYGYTKLKGEINVVNSGARAAILRIAYPFGNVLFPEKDYVLKLIKSIKLGYALFDDQEFTPTYIASLPRVIEKLSESQLSGVFHWVCKGLTTPYKVGSYLNEKLKLGLKVKKGSLAEFEKMKGRQPYAKFGGLATEVTERELKLKPPTWRYALQNFIDNAVTGKILQELV